ncbi:MAG: hypothetical protein WA418_41440, partial [Bradyrhizobium sp.]
MRIATLAAAGLALVCAALYAELVLDLRTQRSALSFNAALGTTVGYVVVQIDELHKQMKAPYGPRAESSFSFPPGKITVTLDGKVVAERDVDSELNAVLGILAVGTPSGPDDLFPFRLSYALGERPMATRLATPLIKQRFAKDLPAWMLAFTDKDWSIDRCVPLAAEHLGSVGRHLRYRRGTACVIAWRGGGRSTAMLISLSQADGDPWLRPFARRVCRAITEAARDEIARLAPPELNYAACLLV